MIFETRIVCVIPSLKLKVVDMLNVRVAESIFDFKTNK